MSLSTLFLAPVTRTSPASRAPPTIRNASTGPRIGDPAGPVPTRRALPQHRYARGMVNLTRIYTRTGDDGTTALGDMSRVGKNDLRLQAYADTDEANSSIGVAIALGGLDDGRRRAC